MNTVQSFFLITLLLITALLALTVVLIVVTEQPDSLIEGRHRAVQFLQQNRTEKQRQQPVKDHRSSAASSSSASTQLPVDLVLDNRAQFDPSDGGGKFDSPAPPFLATTTKNAHSMSALSSLAHLPMDFALEKLAQFGPFDGGKFVGIQLLGDHLYLPKDDGHVEVRDSVQLVLIRTVSTGIRIHRLRAVNERIFVILDNTFGRLVLFDALGGTVLRERHLNVPAKELTLDGALVLTLARFGTPRIDSFELDDLRPVATTYNNNNRSSIDSDQQQQQHQNNCNSISGDDTGAALLLTCGGTLIKMATNGSMLHCATPPMDGVNFSALLVTRTGKLFVVSKTQRTVYLMDKNNMTVPPIVRLHHYDGTAIGGTTIWIWTNFALDQQNGGATLFILEYISNRVEVFKMPSDVLHLL